MRQRSASNTQKRVLRQVGVFSTRLSSGQHVFWMPSSLSLAMTVEFSVMDAQARRGHASVRSLLPRGWREGTRRRATRGTKQSDPTLLQGGSPGESPVPAWEDPVEPTQPLPPSPGLPDEAVESQKCSCTSQLQFPQSWLPSVRQQASQAHRLSQETTGTRGEGALRGQ